MKSLRRAVMKTNKVKISILIIIIILILSIPFSTTGCFDISAKYDADAWNSFVFNAQLINILAQISKDPGISMALADKLKEDYKEYKKQAENNDTKNIVDDNGQNQQQEGNQNSQQGEEQPEEQNNNYTYYTSISQGMSVTINLDLNSKKISGFIYTKVDFGDGLRESTLNFNTTLDSSNSFSTTASGTVYKNGVEKGENHLKITGILNQDKNNISGNIIDEITGQSVSYNAARK
jgi:hypothetical protein